MHLSKSSQLGYNELLKTDLNEVIEDNAVHFKDLSSKRVLLLGGTGFVGKWLLASLVHARIEMSLDFEIVVVTRDSERTRKLLNLNHKSGVFFLDHDLSKGALVFPDKFDVLVHGATPSVPSTGSFNETNVRETSINATRCIIDASKQGSRVLNLSSGAVFGSLRNSRGCVPELGKVGTPINSYAEAKIEIEKSLDEFALRNEIHLTHARLFAFAGPYISLIDHFAVGNFIQNVITGTDIVVKGNSKTTRSYMYPTDLVSSLMRLITEKSLSHINIGSPVALTMRELAQTCSKLGGKLPVIFKGENEAPSSYVPEAFLLSNSLGLANLVTLEESLSRWIMWLKAKDFS
ncbi:WcaG Nucleoside-diphosphate-sugar epimerases [Candidatus Nanopelagicaceae bacterium]